MASLRPGGRSGNASDAASEACAPLNCRHRPLAQLCRPHSRSAQAPWGCGWGGQVCSQAAEDWPGSSLTRQAGPQDRAILSQPDFTPFLSPELSGSLGRGRTQGTDLARRQDPVDGTRQYLSSFLTALTGAPGFTGP